MSLWQEVAHHYQDYEEPTPPSFERKDQHTARQAHHCEDCEGEIRPGERYNKWIWKDDEGFHIVKAHVDREACAAMRRAVEAWREEQYAAACQDWNAPAMDEDLHA